MSLDKPIATLFGLAVLSWIGYMVMATNPSARIDRACTPVRLGGSVVESVAALTAPTAAIKVREAFADFDYGCQYTIWRAVYEEDYVAAKRAGRTPLPDQQAQAVAHRGKVSTTSPDGLSSSPGTPSSKSMPQAGAPYSQLASPQEFAPQQPPRWWER